MPGVSLGLLEPLLSRAPLWLVGLLVLAMCLLARHAGALVYRHWTRGKAEEGEHKGNADGYIISSIFGLLAFLLGITFSIALDRFDTRRNLVAEEANAISTAYLSASLFDAPERRRLQDLIREYARLRIAPQGLWSKGMEAQMARTRALRVQIWDAAHAAAFPMRDTDLAPYVVEAMTDMLNVGVRREVAGRAFIPARIVDVLFLYLLSSSAVLGYLLGDDRGRRRRASTLLIVLLAIALLLILDVDRPRLGTIQVPQRALEELTAALDRDAARGVPELPR